MKKVYGYVRVSTREQNTDRQMLVMKEAGVPEAGIFVDHMSGKDFCRPAYQRLLECLDGESLLYAVFITKLNK